VDMGVAPPAAQRFSFVWVTVPNVAVGSRILAVVGAFDFESDRRVP
jgi:hypothetical protein